MSGKRSNRVWAAAAFAASTPTIARPIPLDREPKTMTSLRWMTGSRRASRTARLSRLARGHGQTELLQVPLSTGSVELPVREPRGAEQDQLFAVVLRPSHQAIRR